MSTKTISGNALNLSIPSTLTNEIPHLSIYNILNKHLRNKWSESLIGRTSANYGLNFNSQKLMNGKLSENYQPRNISFTDVEKDRIYNVDIEKIDFSVDGAVETEIDYLMHENARYLSKLYPDDFNTVYTLTEAERQSYLNEAAHMIHSYFDTEQLVTTDVDSSLQDLYNLYYRVKFLTGITKAKSYTGVSIQEEKLLNLLNTGAIRAYSGYKTFTSPDGLMVVSNNSISNNIDLSDIQMDSYFYLNKNTISKESSLNIHGKVRNVKLRDFLGSSSELINVNRNTFATWKKFSVLNSSNPLDFVNDLISGKLENTKSFNLNQIFRDATASGTIRAGAGINNLKTTIYGSSKIDLREDNVVYFCFSQGTNTADLVAFGARSDFRLQDLENKLVAASGNLSELKSIYILQLGELNFTDAALNAIGNTVFSDITFLYRSEESFATFLDTFVSSADTNQTLVKIEQNKKLIFAGVLNKDFFSKNTYLNLINNYSAENFNNNYSATELFSCIIYKDLIEDIDLDVKETIDITYQNIILDQEKYINMDTGLVYLKKIPGLNNYKIFLNKTNEDDYDICITYRNTEGYSITYTGNTGTGILTSKELETSIVCKKSGNEISIGEDTYVIESNNIILDKKSNSIVGKLATSTYKGIRYVDPEVFLQLAIKLSYEYQASVFHQNTLIYENSSSSSILSIGLDWYQDLQTLIEENTNSTVSVSVYDAPDGNQQYLYSTMLSLRSNDFTKPENPINNMSLASILFNTESLSLYKLQTHNCYFYANNTLRLKNNIITLVNQFGRLNCLILDNYGNFYPAKICKAFMKNDYCYATLLDSIPDLVAKENRNGCLIIDIESSSDTSESENENENEKDRRKVLSKAIHVFQNNKYIYKYKWEDLRKANLNYIFDNINSENVSTSYAIDSNLTKNTNVASSLSELENCTIFDSIGADENTKKLLLNLIDENKSLYLDSTTKNLVNIPFANNAMVYSDQYQSFTYTLNNNIPSSIVFYRFEDYQQYKPLQDLINSIESTDIGLVDLSKNLNRRFVVWGDVVWDANTNSRSVNVLRSIWSSYFANFEIYDSGDVLPDESLIYGYIDSDKLFTKTQNILNYNYAENNGAPSVNWNIALAFSKQNTNNTAMTVIDAYSHQHEDAENNNFIIFDKDDNSQNIYTNNFYFYTNKVDLTSNALVLTSVENRVNNLNLNQTRLSFEQNKNINLRYTDGSYKAFVINSVTTSPSIVFNKNENYKVDLMYNFVYLEDENFNSTGIFKSYCKGNVALELLLDYYTYQYYSDNFRGYSKTVDDFIDNIPNISTYPSAFKKYFRANLFEADAEENWGNNTNRVINLDEVLDYLIATQSTFGIPAIAILDKLGNVKIHMFMLAKVAEKDYKLYSSVIMEKANGDLLYSLMPFFYKKFQVRSSLFNLYARYVNLYQYLIPENATGSVDDISIDLQVNKDANQVLLPSQDLTGEDLVAKENFLSNFTQVAKKSLADQIDSYLTDLSDSTVTVDETNIRINDRTYKLSNKDMAFKEYHNTVVQLTAEEPTSPDYDIKKCNINFNKDFKLTNKGYLYLFDIKATNKRTSYLPSRETQIVDRKHIANNLNILAYKLQNNSLQLLLQDNLKSYNRNTSRILNEVRPTDKSKNNQLIDDPKLTLGLTWKDPGLDVGYTFYKRKFIAEGSIDSSDTKVINLTDTSLTNDENFTLVNHVSVGDKVQIFVNSKSSRLQEGQLAEIDTTENDNLYNGPYKVIYTNNTTVNSEAVQNVILAGAGNLVYVKVNLSTSNIQISRPVVFDISQRFIAYTLNSGEILYFDDKSKTTKLICKVHDFIENSGELTNIDIKDVLIVTSDEQVVNLNKNITENKLSKQHSNWYDFNLQDKPTIIIDSIPLNSGYLNFDNFDRSYFEVDNEKGWKSLPDKLEYFNISKNINIENASTTTLKTFIRNTLSILFGSVSNSNVADLNSVNNIDNVEEIQSLLEPENLEFTISTELGESTTLNNLTILAKKVYKQDSGVVDLKTATIYLPEILDIDVPVYFENSTSPKWKKSKIIKGSTITKDIEEATIDELKAFAEAIQAVNVITRENTKTSSYQITNKNVILFDENTATITIADKAGNLQTRLAIDSLGLMQPVISQNVTNLENVKAYSLPSKLYIETSVDDFNKYVDSCNNLNTISIEGSQENTWGIYSIFDADQPLYLPKVFEKYSGETLESIKTSLSNEFNEITTGGRLDEVANLIKSASNVDEFTKWLDSCKHLNYINSNLDYIAFSNKNSNINLDILSYALRIIFGEDSISFIACNGVLEVIQNSLVNKLLKGIDCFDENTEGLEDFVNKNVTAIETSNDSICNFESLINSASIEVTENFVHIYGNINWPALSGENSILSKIATQLETTFDNQSDLITNITNRVKSKLEENFGKFYGNEAYPLNGATKNFRVSIDLNTYKIQEIQTILDPGVEDSTVLAIKNNSNNLIALTNKGVIDLGSEDSQVVTITSDSVNNVNIKNSNLSIYEALKSLDNFKQDINVNSFGKIQIQLTNAVVQNPEILYSTIASVSKNSIRLLHDVIVLDDNDQVDVTFFVQNLNKPNFKFGFGKLKYLESINSAQTIFEVNSSDYADFASYENKASSATLDETTGLYKKDSVFDIYPTFEVIDENKRSNFYKVNKDNSLRYLENKFGNKILRISNVYGEIGGRLVLRDINTTVANEHIDDSYIANAEDINNVLLLNSLEANTSYSILTQKYNLQFIPEFVDSTLDSIENYSYKDIPINTQNATNFEIFENYAIANFELKDTLSIEKTPDTFSLTINDEVISLSSEDNLSQTNLNQLNDLNLDEGWNNLSVNLKLLNLKLKIVNKSETLPKFVNITKITSKVDNEGNLILDTEADEIYIPEKGYGQAILGDYTTPENCLFEDNVFFDSTKKTVNKLEKQFVLVDADGNSFIKDKETLIPKMLYKSFAQANVSLDSELATRENAEVADSLIDLSNFDVDNQNIWFEKSYKLNLLNFAGSVNISDTLNTLVYDKFLNNLKFSCKLIWSEQEPDLTSNSLLNLTRYTSKYYSSADLLNYLGYSRLYKNLSIPSNYKYLNSRGSYSVTTGNILRDSQRYSADENGNLLYLDTNGNVTTTKTVNPPLPAVKNLSTVVLLSFNNGKINTVVDDCFYLSKYAFRLDYNNKCIEASSSSSIKSILAVVDPNKSTSSFNQIQDVTGDSYSWSSSTSLKWKFSKDLIFNVSYETSARSYNFAYLKDKAGETIAKIFMKNGVDEDSLLVLSKES